jgi:aspartyl-tRNA(Asn)/glutamyl-tRNA(Gln) amidotransferase subunit A
MVPAALGTDTGGSVRNPASCCGIVGMKPTYGLVGRSGVFPLAFSLDHVGPMTRTVEDNALLLEAIAGPDPGDPASAGAPAPDCTATLRDGVRGLRIGVVEHFHAADAEAHPAMRAAFEAAADTLRRLGATLRPVRLSPLPVWVECGRTIHQAESHVVHERWLQERPADYCARSRARLLPGAFIRAADYLKAQQARTVLRAELDAVLAEHDALILLSGFEPPCPIEDAEAVARTYDRHARMPFNLTGTPALAVPTGFSEDGLPLGMQIAGRAFDEPMLYRIGWALSEATGLTERRPPTG